MFPEQHYRRRGPAPTEEDRVTFDDESTRGHGGTTSNCSCELLQGIRLYTIDGCFFTSCIARLFTACNKKSSLEGEAESRSPRVLEKDEI
jgi:hypothetical protein